MANVNISKTGNFEIITMYKMDILIKLYQFFGKIPLVFQCLIITCKLFNNANIY